MATSISWRDGTANTLAAASEPQRTAVPNRVGFDPQPDPPKLYSVPDGFKAVGPPGNLSKGAWVGFNPQPEPPKLYSVPDGFTAAPPAGSGNLSKGAWAGFNPQPEPPIWKGAAIIPG